MRKYLVLTSIFALAACGGGGGGSSVAPSSVRSAVSTDVAQSNAAITSMASEVLVGNGQTITPSLARKGTTSYNGKKYTSYRLDDVTFRFSGDGSIIKFGLDDNGRIISASKYDKTSAGIYVLSDEGVFSRTTQNGSEFGSAKTLYTWEQELSSDNLLAAITEARGEDAEGKPTAADLADWIKNQFDKPIMIKSDSTNINVSEALKDEIEEEIDKWASSQNSYDTNGEWFEAVVEAAKEYYKGLVPDDFDGTPSEYSAKLNVLGANIGLKYADLGFADLQIASKESGEVVEHTFSPYIGGYNAVERDLGTSTEFTGTALAGIEHTDSNGDKDSVLVRQNNATLTMNVDGTSSLEMNNLKLVKEDGKTFDESDTGWYTVTVNKASDGSPTFIIGGSNTMDEQYKLPSMPTGGTVAFTKDDYDKVEREYVKTDTDAGNDFRYGGYVENHVYGTSASDIEAVSSFGFSNEKPSTHESVAIYGAFGGAPTPAQ